MIRKALVPVDFGSKHLVAESLRDDVVVDAPPHVVGPGLSAVGPPRVLLRLLFERSERIHPAVLAEHLVQPGPFFGKAPRVFLVGLPVLDVGFLVNNVPVAADDRFAALAAQLVQVLGERIQAPILGLLALFAGRARRQVDGDDVDAIELHLEVAALVVKFLVAVAAHDLFGLVTRVDGDTAVAFLHGIFVVAVIARGREDVIAELVDLRLGFLDADDVRVLPVHPVEKPLPGRGADAVGVEADNAKQAVPP